MAVKEKGGFKDLCFLIKHIFSVVFSILSCLDERGKEVKPVEGKLGNSQFQFWVLQTRGQVAANNCSI